MLCTNCYNAPATYHYKTITNGVVKEEHLCKDCAMKLKYGSSQGGGFTDLLSGFFNTQRPQTRVCPVCGTTEGEVSKTAQVGCPKCYETFRNLLDPYIRRVQGSDTHVGATPAKGPDLKDSEVEKLKKELQQAVEKQEYEQAAKIRDEIKKLEGGDNK
jgi:protein arginine kinase activator